MDLQDELKRQNPMQVADLVNVATKYTKSDRVKDESDDEGKGKSQSNPPKNKRRKTTTTARR
jgi:hypothetical protein